MSVEAKEILKDKFWIVESNGERFGTLSVNEEKQYMLTNDEGTRFFPSVKKLNKLLTQRYHLLQRLKLKKYQIKLYMDMRLVALLIILCMMYRKNYLCLQKVKNQKVYIVLVTLLLDLTKAGLKVFVQK